jgi:hypothetical protein
VLSGTSQVVAFASVATPLSYIAASADYTLWDAQLNTLDLALGVNWKGWLAFMKLVLVESDRRCSQV